MAYNYMNKLNKQKNSVVSYYLNDFLEKKLHKNLGKTLVISDDLNVDIAEKHVKSFDLILVSPKSNLVSKISKIKLESYSTIIILNTFNSVFEYENLLIELVRILKKDGKIFATLSSNPFDQKKSVGFWGFTEASTRYLFSKYFKKNDLVFSGYGNVLMGRYHLDGLDVSGLNQDQLSYYDPYYPIIIGVVAIKTTNQITNSRPAVGIEDKMTLKLGIAAKFKRAYYFLDTPLDIARVVRGFFVRRFKTRSSYLNKKDLNPISDMYGFDRGKPVDRVYIEQFLAKNKKYIKGACLEIVDSHYTKMFGNGKVSRFDALDIFPSKKANIHGDLRNLIQVKSNVYDCLIITQTFNVVDDYYSTISESYRILKPGGVLLVTMPTISPCQNLKVNMWRFSNEGMKYAISKYFGEKNVLSSGYGNLEAVKAFWVGLAKEDMTEKEISEKTNNIPLIIGAVAIKK